MIRPIRYLSFFVKKILKTDGMMIAQSGIHPSHRQIEFSLLIVHDNKSVDIIRFLGHFSSVFGIGM